MKRFYFVLALVLTTFAAVADGGNTFEGVMTINYTSSNSSDNTTLALSVKGDNVYIDPTIDPNMASSPTMYLNSKSGDLTILVDKDGQKTALQVNMKVLESIGGASTFVPKYGFDMQSDKLDITKTDETKTINGFKCRKYTYKDADTEGEFWLTTDLGFTIGSLFGTAVTNDVLASGMVMAAKGKETASGKTFEYTLAVKKEEVSASLFKVPSGYQAMNMTALIQQMVQAQGPEAVKKLFDQMVPK